MNTRIFFSKAFEKPQDGEPFRSVVASSQDSTVIVWYVKPGQIINPHVHPDGQDTWIVTSGCGKYIFDSAGSTKTVSQGDIVIAHRNEIHGVINDGDEPLIFTSVVSPVNAGFEIIN